MYSNTGYPDFLRHGFNSRHLHQKISLRLEFEFGVFLDTILSNQRLICFDMKYYFYLARCADNSLYAGFCHSVTEREQKHNSGKGAHYTKIRRPVKIVYFESYDTSIEARRREIEVKKWKKEKKEQLVQKKKNEQ